MTADSARGEFKRGWPVMLSAMLGVGLGLSPLPFYTTGIFAPHLVREFGWSIGQIMAGITITSLVVLFAGPAIGLVATKYGARRVALISTVLFALSFMAFALSNGSLPLYYFTWGMVALLGAGTLPITWTVAVNQRFDKQKGLALGISLMGTGLFGFFCKPFVAALIEAFGWRGAYIGLGLLPLLIAAPAAYFLYFESKSESGNTKASANEGLSLTQTLGQWRFWLIALCLIPISIALAGPIPNMENILKVGGFRPAQIVELTSFIGLSALSGRLIGGWLLDRVWAPLVAFFILMSPGLSCWLLTQPELTPQLALISICLIGFAVGVEYDLVAYLVARYFGLRSYAAIYGALYIFFSLGAGIGPLVFGWSFDQQGSYTIILTASFAGLFVSAFALLTLGKYRYARNNIESAPLAGAAENLAGGG